MSDVVLSFTPIRPKTLLVEILQINDIENSLVSVIMYPFWPIFVHPLNSWCRKFTLNSSIKITSKSSSNSFFCIAVLSSNNLFELVIVVIAGFLSNLLNDQQRSFFNQQLIVELLTLFISEKLFISLLLILLAVNYCVILLWTRELMYSLWISFNFLRFANPLNMFCSFLLSIWRLMSLNNILNIIVRDL